MRRAPFPPHQVNCGIPILTLSVYLPSLAEVLSVFELVAVAGPLAQSRGRKVAHQSTDYSPNSRALFSRKRLLSLMYLSTICTEWCPVCLIMDRSDAPAIAEAVACPARSE